MARNIEIKARVSDLDAIRRRAASLTSSRAQTLNQTDTFFVVPKGRLKLRQFANGSGELIAYERPDQAGPKESVYTRYVCTDAKVLKDTLSSVIPIRGVVVKRRDVLLIGRTRVHLDEVEGLGAFIELEVVLDDDEAVESGEREARDLMEVLGLSEASLIENAYIDLLERLPNAYADGSP